MLIINLTRISKGKINLFPYLDFRNSESSYLHDKYYPLIVYDLIMVLSSYRMRRIYLAASMNYGLSSENPEELTY